VSAPDVSQLGDFLTRHGIGVLLLLVAAFVLFRATRPIVHRTLIGFFKARGKTAAEGEPAADEVGKRVATIEDLVSTTLRFTVVLVTVLVLLTWFELLPVIAGLGVVAAALTLAGQSIVLDYLMGILIVLEGPYYKGDWVQIGGVEGQVEEIGLRRTTLRDASGTVHSVSNGQIRVASNLTRVYARMQVDMTVAFGTDLDTVSRIIDQVGQEMADDPGWHDRLLETPTLTRVPAIGDLGVTLRVTGKVRAADRWAAPSELRRRLLAAFQANGISIPARGIVVDREPVGGSGGGRAPDPDPGGGT
jgi:small conductance mechanosensitive channel